MTRRSPRLFLKILRLLLFQSLSLWYNLQINPKIILTSELTETTPASATYTNTQSGINFPVGNAEPITINLNKDGNDIILDFSVGSTEIILTFTQFTDLGADGYFDEFAVRVKINGNRAKFCRRC